MGARAALLLLALAPQAGRVPDRGAGSAAGAAARGHEVPSQGAGEGVGADGFPVYVWREEHAGKALPPGLTAGFGGTNVERADDALWARERGLDFYVGHAPGRDALHIRRHQAAYAAARERWLAERDPGLLVRAPCLTDPAVRAGARDQLLRSLAARGGDTGLFVSLGDEVGLTPWGDPLDLCRSPTCEAAWDAYAAEHLPPRYAAAGDVDTDAALAALERGDPLPLGAWLARRRFHRGVVVALVAELAATARAETASAASVGSAPHARGPVALGLLGSSGETAFGGFPVADMLELVDVLECYRVGDARELAYTARRPGQRLLATLDLGLGLATTRWSTWDLALRGGDGLVLWSDRGLERDPRQAAALREAVAAVRALRRHFPERDPAPRGVALLHDTDSLALAWLHDAARDGDTWPARYAGYQSREGRREVWIERCLRSFEDAGLLPGALDLADVNPATAQRFGVLVAPELAVLEERDVAALASYLAAGGRLLVAGAFGERDRLGRPRATDVATLLGRSAEGRVLTLAHPRELAELDPAVWSELLRAAGAEPLFELDAELRLPWLQHGQPLGQDRLLGVALPNLLRRSEFPDGPVPVEGLAVRGRGAWSDARVEWLWPPPAMQREGGRVDLRAGEAAVFLLLRD